MKKKTLFCISWRHHILLLFADEGYTTGIKKSSEEYKIKGKIKDISTDMLLCVSSCWSEVKISMLSDEDFGEVIYNAS